MEALMIQDEDPPEIHEIPSPSNDSSNEEASSSMGEFQYGPDVKVGIEELCPICGDKVSGYHYGLQTCESCKGFFKRTVQNKKVYSCVDNRNCAIDKAQRKRCPYCRFQKCLSVGMKLEAVRPDRMRGGRNKFGPMYKRDRAIKQQAVRQRQQMLAQCQMQLSQLNGMSPGSMSGYPNMDSPPDIKPNVGMYMPGQMGPSNMLGSPGRHMMPLGADDNSLPSSPPPHSTSQGHYRDILPPPPHSYQSMMHGLPQPINQLPSPPLQSHGHHSNNMIMSNMSNMSNHHSPPIPMPASTPSPTVPQLIKDLQVNLPNEDEVQEKLRGVVEAQLSAMHPHMMLHQLNMLSQTQTVPKELLQFCCMIIDQNLFLLVEWARTAPFFKELKVEDQMKLLQHCWSEILILEYIMKQSRNESLEDITLATGHRVPITVIDKLGLADCRERLQELIKKFKELNVDHNEHTCLKFLILLNPDISGIIDRQHVEQSQEKVNTALLAYCSSFYANTQDKFGQLLVRLPEIRLISLRAEEYLYFRHLNGDIQEQTLLMEMLHAKRK